MVEPCNIWCVLDMCVHITSVYLPCQEADQSIVISESQDGIEDDRKSSYDDILERMRKNKKRVKKLRNRIHLR